MEALGFPDSSVGKESTYNAGDPCSIPGSGRSPGEGNGNPLQYSGLENPMDRGAWWATVHGVAKSQTELSNVHFHFENLSNLCHKLLCVCLYTTLCITHTQTHTHIWWGLRMQWMVFWVLHETEDRQRDKFPFFEEFPAEPILIQ